jgi:hypothetical protein
VSFGLTHQAQPQPRRTRLEPGKTKRTQMQNKHTQNCKGSGCWLKRIVRCLLGDLWVLLTQESHQPTDSSCQSLCNRTERKEWLTTRVAPHIAGIIGSMWLIGHVSGPLPIIGVLSTKAWIWSICLILLLLFLDNYFLVRSYHLNNRKTPNVQSSGTAAERDVEMKV